MKKIFFCFIFLTSSPFLLQGMQFPQGQEPQKPTKHIVKTDKDMLQVLQQARKQYMDQKRSKIDFDSDPIEQSNNKKKVT